MTGRLLSAVSACVLLAACGDAGEGAPTPADNPAPAATPAPAESPTIASVAEFAGEYRVAGVDGAEIDLPHAITASIDGERIHLTADCVNLAWSYRFQGTRLVTARVPVESCARGLEPSERAVSAALDVAATVHRTPANALEIGGGGHAVTLFSQ